MNTRRDLLLGLGGAATLGWLAWSQLAPQPGPGRTARAAGAPWPNTRLLTHDGREVRFYDDLIRGKVVAINMMYVMCGRICPAMTANLRQVQKMLGARAGRDVFLYSITLQPELDTPQILKEYAERNHVGPGWLFLTGEPADIEELRYSLGFYDRDPLVDGNKATHTGMVRIGNDAYQRWTMAPALSAPTHILAAVNHVDRRMVHSATGATPGHPYS
ncbi:protein SCO1/2 [Geopseudomonas sagittaria]|uniref:Protein SCO1/2 n=1 Tax=Geopseudomonas sagittaria TaxID=1135990 RepID=A0A1I5VNK8_9GAMM|nr:SCO family protein [Pseudomonas sagittaria]SFQ09022.1 protein SCO1/2 [Pseudomonas sagittaria]